MNETLRRLSLAALPLAGALTLLLAAAGPWPGGASVEVLHRQFLVALIGGGLLVAAALPALRLPAAGAAVLAKSAFLLIWAASPQAASGVAAAEALMAVMLAGAFAVLLREAVLEARWEGVLPLRQEG